MTMVSTKFENVLFLRNNTFVEDYHGKLRHLHDVTVCFKCL